MTQEAQAFFHLAITLPFFVHEKASFFLPELRKKKGLCKKKKRTSKQRLIIKSRSERLDNLNSTFFLLWYVKHYTTSTSLFHTSFWLFPPPTLQEFLDTRGRRCSFSVSYIMYCREENDEKRERAFQPKGINQLFPFSLSSSSLPCKLLRWGGGRGGKGRNEAEAAKGASLSLSLSSLAWMEGERRREGRHTMFSNHFFHQLILSGTVELQYVCSN